MKAEEIAQSFWDQGYLYCTADIPRVAQALRDYGNAKLEEAAKRAEETTDDLCEIAVLHKWHLDHYASRIRALKDPCLND